ncbi:TetR/AcrR family transcriptional regulator [Saccharicrinis sp. FJH62]|uniref:TetR/AcrR family transcriptional regulator n=1 Tax=Saccharicrinis sp. FJH62 TaxID=3344657 RepID=UPI0035D436C3
MSEEELNNILDKVKDLFMRYGIKSVTMDDVSRELGISKKTLYQYVSNKEDLVEKVLEYLHGQIDKRDKMCDTRDKNAIEILMMVSDKVSYMMKNQNPSMQYDLKKYYPEIFRKFYEIQREEIYKSIISNINKGKIEELYRDEVNPVLVAKLYLSRVVTIMDRDIFTEDEIRTPGFFLSIMELHIRSLATSKGLKVLEEKLKAYNN